jgi:hypothetical protein
MHPIEVEMVNKKALKKEEPAIYTLIPAVQAHPARTRPQFGQPFHYELNTPASAPTGGPPCP